MEYWAAKSCPSFVKQGWKPHFGCDYTTMGYTLHLFGWQIAPALDWDGRLDSYS